MDEHLRQKNKKKNQENSLTTFDIHQCVEVIPEEWDLRQLREISTRVAEKVGKQNLETLSISAGIGFVNQAEKFGKEISGKQYVNYTVIRQGDFVYNKGNSKTYPQGCIYRLDNRKIAAVPNVFISFRMRKKGLNTDYYKYLFISGFLNHQLVRKINAGVRNDGLLNLYTDDFYSCLVPVPPALEQQKIAKILSLCDEIITLKQQLIEQERKRKKWLLNMLLAPDVEGNIILRLDQVCKINTDSLSENIDPNFAFYYIDITCVENGKISFPSDRVMFKNAPVRARRKIKKNDILMSSVRPLLHAFAKIDFESSKYIASTGFTVLSPKNEALKEIVYQQLFSEHLNKQYNCLLVGTNYPALNIADIASLRISVPKENIELISKTFSTQDKYIYNLEAELSQWKRKKKFLMQILLTGIVRVST